MNTETTVLVAAEAYVMIVAKEDLSLHELHELSEEVEPVLLPSDLFHVNVNGGHVLIASWQSRVLTSFKQTARFSKNKYS